MHISHIGQASFLTSHASMQLQLRDILRVPSVNLNLLLVSILTHDNNIFVEFHTFDLFVKYWALMDVLLSGCVAMVLPPGCAHRLSGFPWSSSLVVIVACSP
jgi:hypothetical protein